MQNNYLDRNGSGSVRASIAASLVLLLASAGLAGCELLNNEDDFVDLGTVTTINYSRHVKPIFERKCTSCHAGAGAAGGLDLSSWDKVIAGSSFGEAVIPYDSERSVLIEMVEKLLPVTHPMEVLADTLTSGEITFLKRWIDEGATNDKGIVPYADSDSLLYVAVQEDAAVYIVDTRANVVSSIVDLTSLGFSPSAKPHHVVVEPDGSYWYVTLIGESLVLKFNRDNELVDQVAFETPGLLAMHPTADFLYVGRSLSAPNPPSSIGRITRSTMEVESIDVVFPRPHALAVDPSGEYVYTASLGQNQLMTVEANGTGVSFTEVVGTQHGFVQHAISKEREQLYTTAQLSGQVLVFDISDPLAMSLEGFISVNGGPWHPVITPDDKYMYFGNNAANTITIVSLDQLTIDKVLVGNGIAQPHGSAVRGDGKYVYISNRNTNGAYQPRHAFGDNSNEGTIVVVDTGSQEIVKVLEVGPYAAGLAAR